MMQMTMIENIVRIETKLTRKMKENEDIVNVKNEKSDRQIMRRKRKNIEKIVTMMITLKARKDIIKVIKKKEMIATKRSKEEVK